MCFHVLKTRMGLVALQQDKYVLVDSLSNLRHVLMAANHRRSISAGGGLCGGW
jgi:hypothetical protein